MESFTESLNRLKEVHENEVRGECHGAGWGQVSLALTWARSGCSYRSPPILARPGDPAFQAQTGSPNPEPRAAT